MKMRLSLLLSGVIAVGCAGAAAYGEDPPVALEDIVKIQKAAPAEPFVPPAQPRRVLVYTGCKGFVHDAIPYCSVALQFIGKKSGAYDVLIVDDPVYFTAERLQRFDAVCLNNTTGELFDDPELKRSLLEFVRGGKGLVGIHAATDCFYEWPEFGELMGGYFDGHPWNEEVTIKVEEPDHPLTKMFGAGPFVVADEIYQFKAPYSRDRLRVLLSLDTARTDMTKAGIKRTDKDFAVSWVRNYGRGRVFYCSLGHRQDIFWNAPILLHYLAGIQFACGDLPACAVASGQRAADGWLNLLNGRDLTGWMCKPGSWTVEEGVLTRQGGGDIWTEQRFGDFVLELEFKLAEKTNSGVFFRCGDIDNWLHTCIEMQVLDSHGKAQADKHDCGAIYDIKEPSRNAVKPAGEWNRAVLTCRGSRVLVELNGEPIIDIDLDQWTEAGKNPDGTANKFKMAYKDMPRVGHIGLQDHGNPVWYRNIRIKPQAK